MNSRLIYKIQFARVSLKCKIRANAFSWAFREFVRRNEMKRKICYIYGTGREFENLKNKDIFLYIKKRLKFEFFFYLSTHILPRITKKTYNKKKTK